MGAGTTLGDLQKAANLAPRVEGESPALPELLEFARLIRRYSKDRFQAALPYAEKAVRLYPESSEAHLEFAIVLDATLCTDYERICRHVERAIELGANSAIAYNRRGNCHARYNRLDDAIADYQRAIQISRGDLIDAYSALGFAFARQARNKEALEALHRYLDSGQPVLPQRYLVETKIQELEKRPPR